MGNLGAKHGYLAIILSAALFTVVAAQKLGALFDSSTAFKMKNGNKRSPDISFFAKERLQGLDDLPIGFLEGAPDLVVEILSPTNTIEEIDEQLIRPLASIKTLTLNPSPKSGEGLGNQQRNRCNSRFLSPLRPPWEKGLGDEGC